MAERKRKAAETHAEIEKAIKKIGVAIQYETVTRIMASDGLPVAKGDHLLLLIKGQNIVCNFIGLEGGYFRTRPDVGGDGEEIKYRISSIEKCLHVLDFRVTGEEKLQPAAETAAIDTAEPALAPAT